MSMCDPHLSVEALFSSTISHLTFEDLSDLVFAVERTFTIEGPVLNETTGEIVYGWFTGPKRLQKLCEQIHECLNDVSEYAIQKYPPDDQPEPTELPDPTENNQN